MNKRFLVGMLALLGVGALAWLLIIWFANSEVHLPPPSHKEMAKAVSQVYGDSAASLPTIPAAPLIPSQPVRLAIGTLGLPDEGANRQLGDLVLAALTGTPGLELIERQTLDKVLQEAEMNLASLVRAKDAVRVGKLLRADWFLLGSSASAGASNAIVARIVDAHTGILRDVGVFPTERATPQAAAQLADLVRHCQHAVANSQPRVYLALGTFRDLSVNSRQAAFPGQLRAQLTAAYQTGDVTLLEREYVNTLLEEVRLDLAGLTQESAPNPPVPMQTAVWLVDGYYQSYETADLEIELGLNIKRIFGRSTTVVLRDRPGPALLTKAKQAIDVALNRSTDLLAPTRVSELRAQLAAGKELLPRTVPGEILSPSRILLDEQEIARRRHNLEEAIRAFQTVLLLDPTNREARIYLAGALRMQPLNQERQARDFYLELLREPVQDQWTSMAQQALRSSLRRADAEERASWLQAAAGQNRNSSAAAFLQSEAQSATADVVIQRGQSPDVKELAEARLFEKIRSFDARKFYQSEIGMDTFAETFGIDKAAAARRLTELYPEMKAQAPESAPYLVATIVTFQVETNAPIIAVLDRTLEWCAEHPDRVPTRITSFWSHLLGAYTWSIDHKVYGLSAKILEAKCRAAGKSNRITIEAEDKMGLAFAYKALGRWQDALKIFESYTNHPVSMGGSGPWGPAFTVVLTSREAAQCRAKLGLPPLRESREFDLGSPVLALCPRGYTSESQLLLSKFGAFAATPDGLWVSIAGQLLQLDFQLKTNLVITLPIPSSTPITSICWDTAHVWIGTGGAGLVEYDLARHQCHRLAEKDGLMLDFISSLHLSKDALWVGYGQASSGGVGKLDLKTRRLISFTPSLSEAPEGTTKPPRNPVVSLTSGTAEDLWLVTKNDLYCYRNSNKWESIAGLRRSTSLASDTGRLFVGIGPNGVFDANEPCGLGVRTLRFSDGRWKSFPAVDVLPTDQVNALTVDGQNVWVGGRGYIALIDPAQDKVLRFAYVPAGSVEQIQVGGGYVWAQFNNHLYRALITPSR